jgi:hypothetical protein
VHGAGGGLDEHGGFVAEVGGHVDQLAGVGHHLVGPAAAGVGAEAALQAGGEVAVGDALAQVDVPAAHERAHRRDAARDAGEHRDQHDAAIVGETTSATTSWPGVNG